MNRWILISSGRLPGRPPTTVFVAFAGCEAAALVNNSPWLANLVLGATIRMS
ncbi:MAG: hypothetical protein ABGX07_15980 [Pirellulaceae bacterium]